MWRNAGKEKVMVQGDKLLWYELNDLFFRIEKESRK